MLNPIQEYSVSSQYLAPRGRDRMMYLGEQIAQRHLSFRDRLIGIVGDAGSGKSSLIKGMFPGLSLTNDDDTLDSSKIMQVRGSLEDLPDASTYHLDMRFQTAFTQMYEIVDFVNAILERGRRIVIEHFNLLCPALGRNADILVGIGEEIIVTRPNIFGPLPQSIYDIVHESLKYRKMAHTVEDITILILQQDFGISCDNFFSSDIRNGFLLRFPRQIELDFDKLAERIDLFIKADLEVSYADEDHIMIGKQMVPCTGPRLHIRKTSDVEDFRLVRRFIRDPKNDNYCLVGLIGDDDEQLDNRNTVLYLKRK